jgi:mRNA interferase RelE/StbE
VKYKLEFSQKAKKQLAALDMYVQKRVQVYINRYIEGSENPRLTGKPLKGDLVGYWRYRIGDYRIICEIHDDVLTVVAVQIGHRNKIYL